MFAFQKSIECLPLRSELQLHWCYTICEISTTVVQQKSNTPSRSTVFEIKMRKTLFKHKYKEIFLTSFANPSNWDAMTQEYVICSNIIIITGIILIIMPGKGSYKAAL